MNFIQYFIFVINIGCGSRSLVNMSDRSYYCEYLKARLVNLGQLGLTGRSSSILTGRRRMKSQPLNNCSLFDLLTSQPIHHVQTENSRNFISFLFRFNFIPLYSYSCLFTLRINIWSDVIFF